MKEGLSPSRCCTGFHRAYGFLNAKNSYLLIQLGGVCAPNPACGSRRAVLAVARIRKDSGWVPGDRVSDITVS